MRESAWSEAQTTTRSTLDRPEFPDFFGEGGCERAKFRHLGTRKTSSEREWPDKYVHGLLPIYLERT